MTGVVATEWEQYAVIAYLAQKLGGSGRLGRKAVQKYVYLIQELEDVPVGYRFDFYTYGPYSRDLAGDLDVVNSIGGVLVSYDLTDNAYHISAGEASDEIICRGNKFLQIFRSKLDAIITNFGGRYAKDLELIATIVYFAKSLLTGDALDCEPIVRNIQEIKPKFDVQTVRGAIGELNQLGYLSIR